MKFILRIAARLHVIMIIFISVIMIMYAFHYLEVDKFLGMIRDIYFDENLRIICAGIAVALLILNYVFFHQVLTTNAYEKRAIAFDNPAGRVNVSLAAIEDLTKRIISRVSEVREVKSRITVSKKGLLIKIKLILRAEGSIPEVTSRVQDMVKKKVQDTIGLDEPIEVAIFVGKILPDQTKDKKVPKKDEEPPAKESPQNIPFQGYRA